MRCCWTIGLLGLLAMTALNGCSLYPKVGRHGGEPQIIAHRGASAEAPENTLAAFSLAADEKADWFELDCYLTADDQLVVCHDGDTSRTGDRALPIATSSLADLKQVDIGRWKGEKFAGERIPLLAEALTLAMQRRIGVYIEIKSMANDGELEAALLKEFAGKELDPAALDKMPKHEAAKARAKLTAELVARIDAAPTRNAELARAVAAEVRRNAMERQVVIQSFSPIVCAVVKHEAPELRVELLGYDDTKYPHIWRNFMAWQHLLDVQGANISNGTVTPERVAELHAMGRTIAVWTVDDPAEILRFNKLGVDGLITNRPAETRAALKSH